MSKLEINLPPISVIIPAYNEQKWIKKTVTSVLESGFPCELIVVNDGSTDNTQKILESFGEKIKLIIHQKNKGKGAAVSSGIKNANGEIIVLLDAHLLGLTKLHLLSLVLPLVYNQAKVVIGVGVPKKISLAGFRSPMWILSGQRAYFKKDLLPLAKKFENLGYGIEVFLYNKFKNAKTTLVSLPGLIHLIKKDTSTPGAALKNRKFNPQRIQTVKKNHQAIVARVFKTPQNFFSRILAHSPADDQPLSLFPPPDPSF